MCSNPTEARDPECVLKLDPDSGATWARGLRDQCVPWLAVYSTFIKKRENTHEVFVYLPGKRELPPKHYRIFSLKFYLWKARGQIKRDLFS